MPYSIYQFGTWSPPKPWEPGQEQNMGTGAARTSWQALPNGTYFDNYHGVERRPQGIRPIIKEGMIYGATSAAVETVIDDARSWLGVRDKLTVRFYSGNLRWQEAVLKDVNTPSRPFRAFACPMQLVFETVAQHWYEVRHYPVGWTIGDGTWNLGDGTAQLGESGTQETLTATGATGTAPPGGGTTQTITLTHNGNIRATNLIWTITAGTNDIDAIQIENLSTGETIYYNTTVAAGTVLSIDCGAQDILNNGANAYTNFTPSNKGRWMTLAKESDNTILVTVNGNAAQDGTIAIEYYDHFA